MWVRRPRIDSGLTIPGCPNSPLAPVQCDIISGGSQVNPSVSVAMFVHGAISFPGAVVRIVAQLVAGIVAYPLLCVPCEIG